MATASAPDILRLVAVPAFGYAAWTDLRTRRVTNRLWPPLVVLGLVLLVVEGWGRVPPATVGDRLFLIRVAASVGILIPLSYLLWRVGGFGGADAKAFMTVAVLLPTYPAYFLPGIALPAVRTATGLFSLTVVTNAVLVGAAYPLAVGARNAVDGVLAPTMFLARRVPVGELGERHGRLFETPDEQTRRGLDLDALRMYLRWRGTTLSALRGDPAGHRDPSSVGETTAVGDGGVDGPPVADGGLTGDDPWAAGRFADEVGEPYGTTPETLRDGLRVVSDPDREAVWVSPGIPFVVPMFVGLVVALTYGDLLFGLLAAVGGA
ncbi:MAG: prepilin peptidase related protein [uncultured archaeon A07HB70]|nr:MAG: prepilin peptidase related protein [uncultured archaeon A07HB70]